MLREVLAVKKRVLMAEHSGTMATANNLATSLSRQGKHAEAEMDREVQRSLRDTWGCNRPKTKIRVWMSGFSLDHLEAVSYTHLTLPTN